jgi:mono/diheme cytochrome c family protein
MARAAAPGSHAGTEGYEMSTRRWHHVAALLVIAASWSVLSVPVSTQSPAPAAAMSAAVRGEAWFYQRCSLCHMGRIVKDDTFEPMAPRLDGVLKSATPEREKAVRQFIQQGSLRMPGFRYNFPPSEFEELMAYLKTL